VFAFSNHLSFAHFCRLAPTQMIFALLTAAAAPNMAPQLPKLDLTFPTPNPKNGQEKAKELILSIHSWKVPGCHSFGFS